MAVGVHDAKALLGHRTAGAAQKPLLVFQQRRLDPAVGVRGKNGHDRIDAGRFGLRVRRQQIPQAGGQQRWVGCVVDVGRGHVGGAHLGRGHGGGCLGAKGWDCQRRAVFFTPEATGYSPQGLRMLPQEPLP